MASSSHLLFRPTPPPTILKPLSILSTFLKAPPSATACSATTSSFTVSSLCVRSLSSPRRHTFLSHSPAPSCLSLSLRRNRGFLSFSTTHTPAEALDSAGEVDDEEEDEEDNGEVENEEDALPETNEKEIVSESEGEKRVEVSVEAKKVPKLTVKEKKDLASYARTLGDKLKTQQIGKSGVTANVYFALNEMLEANELLKLKVHNTCPDELDDVVKKLEQGTGSAAVSQVGRTVIFYRPSLSKLKEAEKKKQAAIAKSESEARSKAFTQRREQRPTESGRGRGSESGRGRGSESGRGRGSESGRGRGSESGRGRGTESSRGRRKYSTPSRSSY